MKSKNPANTDNKQFTAAASKQSTKKEKARGKGRRRLEPVRTKGLSVHTAPLDYVVGADSRLDVELARLRDARHRITRPRIAMVTAMLKIDRPATVEAIFLAAGRICDLVTTYRCLETFEEIGLVRRTYQYNNTSLFEVVHQEPRYYIASRTTGKVQAFDAATNADVAQLMNAIQKRLEAQGYTAINHAVQLFAAFPQENGHAANAS